MRIVNAAAPIRICDNGGWTDTWFARHGRVLNIAVRPLIYVQVLHHPTSEFHDPHALTERAVVASRARDNNDPMVQATIELMAPALRDSVIVRIASDVPAGSSTGTSASLSVALVAAIARLVGRELTLDSIARQAHRVETEVLGQQSGIQDQLAAAHGGVSFIEINEFPSATVSPVQLSRQLHWELERRLSLIYVGQAHRSSSIHEMVIRELEGAGPDNSKLNALRHAADSARVALSSGDLKAFGRALISNTECQQELHPELVSSSHKAIIEIARRHGASGWKVNGAGGDGGSVTVLHGPDARKQVDTLQTIEAADRQFRVIPISISFTGVRVWECDS